MWGRVGAPPSFLVGDHRTGSLLGKQTPCLLPEASKERRGREKLGPQWLRGGASMAEGWGTRGGWDLGRGGHGARMHGGSCWGESKTGKAKTHSQGYKADLLSCRDGSPTLPELLASLDS